MLVFSNPIAIAAANDIFAQAAWIKQVSDFLFNPATEDFDYEEIRRLHSEMKRVSEALTLATQKWNNEIPDKLDELCVLKR
jgi:hypothetical protein